MLQDKLFQEIQVEEEIIDGAYKYFIGLEEKKEDIDKIKFRMHKLGFQGAFVVAFYKGMRISTKEALNLHVSSIASEQYCTFYIR